MPLPLRSLRLFRPRSGRPGRRNAPAPAAERFSVNPERQAENRLFCAGLLSVAVVSVIQFVGLPSLDAPQWVSLIAFAAAIPMLAFTLWVTHHRSVHRFTIEPAYELAAEAVGQGAAALGTLALFWHFGWFVGLLFFASALLAYAFHLDFRRGVGHVNR